MRKLAAEMVVVVAGILLALAVDAWRQEREEVTIASEHLSDVAAELRDNLCTVERVHVLMLRRKMDNLQVVLAFLNAPEAPVADPHALLKSFARSTAAARPWLVDHQFQALQNSGHARHLRKLAPELGLASCYEGPEVLFTQVARIQGAYPVVVNELIPAQLQAELNQLSGYARSKDAPILADDADLQHAIERLQARRVELLGLARNEAAVATAQWYALSRIRRDHLETLEALAPWDRATMPIEDQLAECVKPRE